jgi:hypothetical protein
MGARGHLSDLEVVDQEVSPSATTVDVLPESQAIWPPVASPR